RFPKTPADMSRYILMLAEVRQAHGVFPPDRVMRGLKLHSGMKQVCFFTGGVQYFMIRVKFGSRTRFCFT
ncbi:hypothetical protein ACX6W9_005279, partial [Escherichia coli]